MSNSYIGDIMDAKPSKHEDKAYSKMKRDNFQDYENQCEFCKRDPATKYILCWFNDISHTHQYCDNCFSHIKFISKF